jgi:phosphomevalonate decarboxylase
MREAIRERDSYTISDLAEEDSLHLHAITMTGEERMILWEPDTLRIIKQVLRMRDEGVPVWYSHDTGPSLFLNTVNDHVDDVASVVDRLGLSYVICGVGGEPYLTDKHLF